MNNMIIKEYNGNAFQFREDGYFNMTKAAKAFGKRLDNFWDNQETKLYINELSNSLEMEGVTKTTMGRYGGTWAHPKLAVFFARWLDTKFAVWCDQTITTIMKEGGYILGEERVATGEMTEDELVLKAMTVLQSKVKRLTEENEKLTISNELMYKELNELSVNELAALKHQYWTHSFKVKMGRKASELCRVGGVDIKTQEMELPTEYGIRIVQVKVYPRYILEEAYAFLVTKEQLQFSH